MGAFHRLSGVGGLPFCTPVRTRRDQFQWRIGGDLLTLPRTAGIAFGHLARVHKQSLCCLDEPPDPSLDEIFFAALIDRHEGQRQPDVKFDEMQ